MVEQTETVVDEFLKDLPVEGQEKTDAFGEPVTTEPVKEAVVTEEPVHRENRETRRLRERLQTERESSIALAARLEALTEVQKFRNESGTEKPDETLARIYGTNTPEGAEATRLLQTALDAREQRAVDKALEVFRGEQEKSQQAVQDEIQNLNQIEERIEDEYGVDFSTKEGEAMRVAYINYLERMSPKDADGTVKDFADPFATWEEFASKRTTSQQTSQAKEYASRGMTRSGASSEKSLVDTQAETYLKNLGII